MPRKRPTRIQLADVVRELPRQAHDLTRSEVRDSLGPDVGDVLRSAIVGGVNNVVTATLTAGHPERLRGLGEELSAFVESAMRSAARGKRA